MSVDPTHIDDVYDDESQYGRLVVALMAFLTLVLVLLVGYGWQVRAHNLAVEQRLEHCVSIGIIQGGVFGYDRELYECGRGAPQEIYILPKRGE